VRIESGTRVLITGGSQGLGLSLAQMLAERGARVGVIARSLVPRDEGELGPGIELIAADVADVAQLERAIEGFRADAGGIDLLVINAAIASTGRFIDQPFDELDRMVDVNVRGALMTLRLALPSMIAQGRGHVVLTTCMTGIRGFPQVGTYGATRAAIRGISDGLWHELDGTGVGVTLAISAELETGMFAAHAERLPGWMRPREASDPARLARQILRAVEKQRRTLYFPGSDVRLLALFAGAPSAIVEFGLRQTRGLAAAPHRGLKKGAVRELAPAESSQPTLPAGD
jgi:short-subunit dehydrogenase